MSYKVYECLDDNCRIVAFEHMGGVPTCPACYGRTVRVWEPPMRIEAKVCDDC